MRAGVFIVLSLMAAAWVAHADEKLPMLRVGSNVYSNVTVTAVTTTDIYFVYAGGMGNAKLSKLDPALQKHFQYNPAKANETELKRSQANIQYHAYLLSQPAPRPSAGEREMPQPTVAPTSELSWGADLPTALNQARSENKMVLLDFTGSDWCPWCIKFDDDVLSTGKFAGYAQSKLVLVKLDFPRHKEQDAALKQANQEIKKRFGVDGFPTFVLLNSAGRELGRQVGYLRGGPDTFIAELEGFSQK
ncbi:MAG: thioredoxin fold domain-containing protein [Verrucomicrobiota bacterium]|jgi:thiol-disulfide isomerase/thioredoxin